MSLILDALKRSQQDRRDNGAVPGLATEHYPESPPAGRPLQVLPWLFLGVTLALVGWLLLERSGQQPPPGAERGELLTDRSRPDPPVTSPSAGNGIVTAPDDAARSPTAPDHGRTSLAPETESADSVLSDLSAAPTASSRSVPAAENTGKARRAQNHEHAPAQDPAVIALYQRRKTVAPVERDAATGPDAAVTDNTSPTVARAAPDQRAGVSSLDIDSLVVQAQSAVVQQGLSKHPTPFLSELSQENKDVIPSVFYSKHDYAEDGRSSVVLNGKVLGEGDTMGSGVQVEEILEDSVVLSHRGTQFRLKALNSWVNL